MLLLTRHSPWFTLIDTTNSPQPGIVSECGDGFLRYELFDYLYAEIASDYFRQGAEDGAEDSSRPFLYIFLSVISGNVAAKAKSPKGKYIKTH